MTSPEPTPASWTPVLYDMAQLLGSVEDPEPRVDRILALLRQFVPYDRCALLEARPVLRRPITVAPPDLPPREVESLTKRLRSMLALLLEAPPAEAGRVHVPSRAEGSHLAVPILQLGETTGIAFVERDEPSAYRESHLAFLSVVCAQIGAYLSAVRADRDLRASERRFRRLFESGMIGIAFMDGRGQITEANQTFADIVGLSQREIEAGRANWIDMTPTEERKREAAILRAVRRGTCAPYEKSFVRPGGERVTVMAGSAILDSPDALVAFVLDVSERKRAEAERMRLLREREADLEFLQLFMGMLGHDIRNPLSAIRMSAEFLDSEFAPDPRETARRILSSTARIERMVEQLTDVTRIRLAGGMPVEPRRADLAELCQTAVDELRAAHPDASIRLEIQGDATGRWDGDRLLQVISNLVANAVEHAAGGGEVVVRVREAGESVELAVWNPGEIPSEVRPHLFEPFRGTTEKRTGRGLGLGLFITRHIVEAHGGSIHVDTSAERGTTFTVRLPRRAQVRMAA